MNASLEGSKVKRSQRIRSLRFKAMEAFEEKCAAHRLKLDPGWERVAELLSTDLVNLDPSDVDGVLHETTTEYDSFAISSQVFSDYLNKIHTESSIKEKQLLTTYMLKKKLTYTQFMEQLCEMQRKTADEDLRVCASGASQVLPDRTHHKASKSVTSHGSIKSKAKSHTSRISETSLSNMLAEKFAKAEAAKASMTFIEEEFLLKKKQAEMEKQAKEIEAKREFVKQKKDVAALTAEYKALADHMSSEYGSGSDRVRTKCDATDIPILPSKEKVADYISKHSNEVDAESIFDHGSSAHVPLAELTQFLVKKDLLISRLSKFDDTPENFVSWRNSFKNILTELGASDIEELELLIKYLGPQSSKQATILRSAYANSTKKAIDKIWERMEERYGAPELVAESLKRKLEKFPTISAKDCSQLYTLADLLTEVESIQEDTMYKPLFAHFDSSTGVAPIVNKLPFFIQEKWITQASNYKKQKGVVFPPFSFFATFVRDMAKTRNDPSFTRTSSQQARQTSISTKKTEVGVQPRQPVNQKSGHQPTYNKRSTETICPIHKAPHSLNQCRVFKSKGLEERRVILRENHMCYKCCDSNTHQARECKVDVKCVDCGSSKHMAAMHPPVAHNSKDLHGGEKEVIKEPINARCTQINKRDHGKSCAKLVLVNMYSSHNPENVVRCYAMIDDQSNRSLVKPELFSLLDIDGKECEYTINSCTGTVLTSGRKADNCVVESLDGLVRYNMPSLIECTDIPNNKDEICSPENARCFPHLQGVANSLPAIDSSADILLLIGRDIIEAHHVHDQVVGPPHSPFAQKLGLGWVVIGELCLGRVHTQKFVNVYKTHLLDNGRPSLFKPCENKIGVEEDLDPVFVRDVNDDKPALSIEDRQFLQIMDEQCCKDSSGHWVAPLPFRSPKQRLPNNKEQAVKRAKLLDIGLQRNPVKRKHFVEFMDKVIGKGHAELAPELQSGEECWYLPIFGVYHPKKPDQIRGVFDSSAEYKGVSLNSVLLTGPDLTNSLIGILMRFRKEPVAVIADIEQMFYCFSVKVEHRNFLRFLWYQDNDPSKPLVEYRMCKHVFGNSPSPAIATYGLHKSAECGESDVREFVERDFYVDDGLTSRATTLEAVDILQRTQDTLQRSGLRLHKFASNDRDVLKSFPPSSLAKNMDSVEFEKGDLPAQRSLGVGWSLNQDAFIYSVDPTKRPLSKRGILSTVNSVFDPLGFLSPVTIVGKLILRDLVATGCDWDDPLPPGIEAKWLTWRDKLKDLRNFEISRSYFGCSLQEMSKVELHIFSDASEKAISAVVYLVGYKKDGEVCVGFVTGKAKVAPSSGHTIPRLELCAAVLATEVYKSVAENLDVQVSDVKFYTDSRVVLGYIHNLSRRFFTYVSNRVLKIRRVSAPTQWYYVPTEKNPADVGSRGTDPQGLTNSLWLVGPAFLHYNAGSFPEFSPC